MPEPEGVAEGEPENYNDTWSEPEGENVLPEEEKTFPEPERGWQDTPWPEPEPDWSKAFDQLGFAWHLHIYTVGTIFLSIACLAMFSLCYYLRNRQALKHGTMTFSLQCMLLFFSLFRSISMFSDPYHATKRVNGIFSNMIWSIALPALTSSFSVLLLVFLDTTKMTLGPPRFQQLSAILKVTAGHFLVVLLSDVAYLLNATFKPLLLMCRVLFIAYGTLLGVGYMYSAVVIYRKCKAGAINEAENVKIYRIVKMSVVASLTAFAIACTHIYAASSVFGIYSDVSIVDAWDWWIFQSFIRAEEIISCLVILTIAFRNPLSDQCCLMKWISRYTNRKTTPREDNVIPQVLSSKPLYTTHITEIQTSLTENKFHS